jgi:alkylation response protein AidB-like acyl-CoA dehydrogenase
VHVAHWSRPAGARQPDMEAVIRDANLDTNLDFSFNEDQQAIYDAIGRFCSQHPVEEFARQSNAAFPAALWKQLAALGVFSPLSTDDTEGNGALLLCAICEALGEQVFPGPIADTYLAIAVTPEEEAAGLIDGTKLVCISRAGSTLLPFGTEATLFLLVDRTEVSRAAAPESVESVATLGGEIWGRALLRVEKTLPGAIRGLQIHNIATAAYLASLASRLLRDTSEYAATRKQFGSALGDFQAVSHTLADCAIALAAATSLTRSAASAFSYEETVPTDSTQARRLAGAALLSARTASLKTAFVCHQVYAGIGITLEGPVFYMSRRIRQLASQAPGQTVAQESLLTEIGLGAE